MKVRQLLSRVYPFLLYHRVVVLIIGVILLGSIFSLYMLVRGTGMETPIGSSPRKPPKVTLDPGLPPRTLKAWGVDPFKDVIREMEIAEKKRIEAERLRAKQESERAAGEEISAAMARAEELAVLKKFEEAMAALDAVIVKHAASPVPVLEEARVFLAGIVAQREEALKEARRQRELEAQRARQREHRKKVILSLRVDGVISGKTPNESSAIVEGKPYSVNDVVVKNGVEAVLVEILPNAVIFKDPKSRDTYRVPLSSR